MMRFLVITDIHRRDGCAEWVNGLVEEHGLDGVIILGDITHFGPTSYAEELLGSIDVDVYGVPGNCDPEVIDDVIAKHGTSLHGRAVVIDGLRFVGLGGSNPTPFYTLMEMTESEIDDVLRPLMSDGVDVLVTHSPRYGVNDATSSGEHVGSTAIADLVDEFPPKVMLSGHVHEAIGIVEREGVIYMNPGPALYGLAGLLDTDGPSVILLE